MTFISKILTPENELIFFIYGLVYFLIGFAIFMKNSRQSDFGWSRDIRLFTAFAFLHGIAYWAAAGFVPSHHVWTANFYLVLLITFHISLGLSFLLLMVFGLKVAFSRQIEWPIHYVIPAGLLLVWAVISITFLRSNHSEIKEWLTAATALSRYMLGLPAGFVSAFAFLKQADNLEHLGIPRLTRAMRWSALFLVIFGLLTGLVVQSANFFPANVFNYDSFTSTTGISILVFRLAAGIFMSINIMRSLELFDIEKRRRIEEAEKREAILKERERISREIHDGTIQSLYGMGLRLELAQSQVDEGEAAAAKEHLDYTVEHLAETITNIRAYIMNLRHLHFRETSLRVDLQGLVQEFRATTNTFPEYVYREEATFRLTPDQRTQLYYIVREALNNIRKHAMANKVWLEVMVKKNYVEVIIKDNGKGFDVSETYKWGKQGLRSMKERVKELNGKIEIASNTDKGTTVKITIPTEGDKND